MKVIVDTNVAIVANRKAPQASAQCVLQCVQTLQEVITTGVLVIDDGWRIITEYKKNLQQSGQPGVGDAFCKWVLTNWRNPSRCETVTITQQPDSTDPTNFVEFPSEPALRTFDRSDRKYVAIALAHPETPPILNATDTDWWHHRAVLEEYGIQVHFLCADAMPSPNE